MNSTASEKQQEDDLELEDVGGWTYTMLQAARDPEKETSEGWNAWVEELWEQTKRNIIEWAEDPEKETSEAYEALAERIKEGLDG